jgi:hypothetical protein
MSNENIIINMDEDYLITHDDTDDSDNNVNDLKNILKEINDAEYDINSELYYNSLIDGTDFAVKELDYDLNYNVKELLLICEYYGIAKQIKASKLKKKEIITFLLEFEESPDNFSIVYKRKQMWYFMCELKNDKFMKKYLLW